MSFLVTVKGGEDDGKSFAIDGQAIVGRAPGCQVLLSDPKLAWETAALQDQAGRLFIQNLSASGVLVQGQAITASQRLVNGDEIVLTDECSLVVEERIGKDKGRVKLPVFLGILAFIGVVFFAVVQAMQEETPPPAKKQLSHWRTAHQRLYQRMEEWNARGEFPEEAMVLFEDAWRLEIAQNQLQAMKRWDIVHAVLITQPLPGPNSDRRSIAEVAKFNARALDVVMDFDPNTSLSMDTRWNSDESFADALTWFVKKRAAHTRKKVESDS